MCDCYQLNGYDILGFQRICFVIERVNSAENFVGGYEIWVPRVRVTWCNESLTDFVS